MCASGQRSWIVRSGVEVWLAYEAGKELGRWLGM